MKMKKTAIGFLMMACMGFIRNANAAYVIKLKNGNEYITNRYWQAGAQILFDTYGGIFGIDRSFVDKIEQSDRILPLPTHTTEAERTKTAGQQTPTGVASVESKLLTDQKQAGQTVSQKTESATSEPLPKNEEILNEYGELQKRFGSLNDLPKHEVHALDADIESFISKVQKLNQADAHKEELAALTTLRKAIDRYLKAAYP